MGPGAGAPRRPATAEDEVLDLQSTAGNRAVVNALGAEAVQRAPEAKPKNDGGQLVLEGGDPIPLSSASWSVRQTMAQEQVGSDRVAMIRPAKTEVEHIVIRRVPDAASGRIRELFAGDVKGDGDGFERGELRIDRPSAGGGLPGTSLALREIYPVAYAAARGEGGTEGLTIAVGRLGVAGSAPEPDVKNAEFVMHFADGPPLPLRTLRVERPGAKLAAEPIGGPAGRRTRGGTIGATRLTVTLAAGRGLRRLATAIDQSRPLDFTIVAARGGSTLEAVEAFVTRLGSTGEGGGAVEAELTAVEVNYPAKSR